MYDQKVESNGSFFSSFFLKKMCDAIFFQFLIEMVTIEKKIFSRLASISVTRIKLTRNELLPFIKKTPKENKRAIAIGTKTINIKPNL